MDQRLVVNEDFTDHGETIVPEKLGDEALYQVKFVSEKMKERILHAKEENEDPMTVIIYPFTYAYPYTLEELEAMWAKYNSLSFEKQSHSDEHCVGIFGYDNRYGYEINKNILLSLMDKDNPVDTTIESAITAGRLAINSTEDVLSLYEMKLINASSNDSILEAYASEVVDKDIENALSSRSTLSDDLPGLTPYLTPTEIEDFFDDGLTPNAKVFIDEYKKSLAIELKNFDEETYRKTIQELYSQKEKQTYTISMMELGWNPNVAPTDEAFKFARNRIKSYLENYTISIVDVTDIDSLDEGNLEEDMKVPLYPVYVVLTYTYTNMGKLINSVKGSTYSHASIAFDEKLNQIYSYVTGGLTYESKDFYLRKHKDSKCKVLAVFVTKVQLDKIKAGLMYYVSNKNKTHYDTKNLFNILFNKPIKDELSLKQVCSQFVNQLLQFGNVDIFGDKSNNLVSPDDFDKSKNSKLYVVYEGLVRNYKPTKVRAKVNALISKQGMKYMRQPVKEAARLLSESNYIEDYRGITCNESEIVGNAILEKIHDLVTPESVLVEARKLPISINAKGVTVEMPVQIEEQYQEVHKTLLVYDKEGSIEQMKPELARLWYLNLLCERKIRFKTKRGKTEDVKKIRDTRARIMNDFKKYLKAVLKVDPEFDFAKYYEQSEYNDRSFFIDRATLLYSGKAIANVIKNITGR